MAHEKGIDELMAEAAARRALLTREDEIKAFRDLLRRPDFSHVSYRTVGVPMIYVYRVAPESPSHCLCMGGVYDTEEARQVLREENARQQGAGEMGEAACRAGIRGC
jgi:hypothetical protein